jgi:3-deoxy-D-manno-octulosonate 8-phosphate phosphatase (KDO 8-P phosphatase)
MPTDQEIAAPIRLILSDVDGVMTDGRIVYDNAGVETKSFHVRDGLGIRLWQRAGYRFGLVTARNSQIVRHRAAELGIDAVRQGFEEKWPAVQELMTALGVAAEEVCYLGDDLPDLPVMRRVALSVTVADAAEDVRRTARWTTRLPGGAGAVRELIERLLKAKSQWQVE